MYVLKNVSLTGKMSEFQVMESFGNQIFFFVSPVDTDHLL